MEYDAIWKAVHFLEDVAITKFSAPTVDALANINAELSTMTQQIPCQLHKGEPWGYKK
jgi:hypothetical protein